ncbi:MAG: hypothetical protein DSY82_07785, partial [Flavobacteriia bacterium]
KSFTGIDNKIYAAADNAVFIYDKSTQEIQKFSSVNGLSGKTTTYIYFSEFTGNFVVGYDTGLIEIVDTDGKITLANDIERLDISGEKRINHISENKGILYLSTPFGIVEYDLEKMQFGDTFFIGAGSSAVYVNQTTVFQNRIYAATRNGIFSAEADNDELVDFNNWIQPTGLFMGDFTAVEVFHERLFAAKQKLLLEIFTATSLLPVRSFSEAVLDLKASAEYLTLTNTYKANILNSELNQVFVAGNNAQYKFTLHSAFADNDKVYLATKEFGILQSDFGINDYTEIHPEGPSSNQVFSITAGGGNLWVVYGGFDAAFTPLGKRLGYSHYNKNEQTWINIPYSNHFPAIDLVHVTIDPEEENKVYISSWNSGILVVENDEPLVLWDESNSGLEDLYPPGSTYSSIRINGTAFDDQHNFWVANAWVDERLKKMNNSGGWTGFSMNSLFTNPAFGLTELIVDKTKNIWIGSRRNGALVFNETGNRKKALKAVASKGNLPDPNVRSIVADRSNRIWIGTQKGLVVFQNPGSLFDSDVYDAKPVIIDDEGIPKKLLGDQPVNTIAVDGADNKWFGTDTGGVLNTNPSGSKTFYNFNKDNSPLPSNRILKISIDDSKGVVYIATDKGIVAFNNNVAPYGNTLSEVYAYPNPVRKEHETVTIDGRNGEHLPRGTNVKILDTAGHLVFETNVVENQVFNGGKVIWNKTNMAGRPVASGIYIVLLTLPDKSETSTTKIAIIN